MKRNVPIVYDESQRSSEVTRRQKLIVKVITIFQDRNMDTFQIWYIRFVILRGRSLLCVVDPKFKVICITRNDSILLTARKQNISRTDRKPYLKPSRFVTNERGARCVHHLKDKFVDNNSSFTIRIMVNSK